MTTTTTNDSADCNLIYFKLPEAATSLTGLFCSLAMNPMTEKIANPEKKLVPELMTQTSSDCLLVE